MTPDDPSRTTMGLSSPGTDTVGELMTVADLCAWLKVPSHWVYDQVEARRIPYIRLGRRSLRFTRREIEAYLDANSRAAVPAARPAPAQQDRDELEALD
jgi:excisionase family DNA binding protein